MRTFNTKSWAIAAGLGIGAALGGCAASDGEAGDDGPGCAGAKCDDPNDTDDRMLCVGIRGNGERIFAHFGALSRIVEHYGLIDGASGGSSASITIFLTESVQINPHIYECGDKNCSADETAARAALLLKSLQGYLEVLADTDEARAFAQLAPIASQVQAEGIGTLAQTDVEAARQALVDLLGSPELRDLINPEVMELLTSSPNPAFHTRDIIDGITGFKSFSVESDRILIRPGVLDFRAVADKVGRIGSFYAGYGPLDGAAMEAFMASCATPGRGLTWRDVAALPAGDTTCGAVFADVVTRWREGFVGGDYPSRIDDSVGDFVPALVSTSVLEGAAVEAFNTARADYLAGNEYTFEVNFDDVRFGYWGLPADLELVEANLLDFDDVKTRKTRALGQVSWREALSLSPAEPGLARALEMDGGVVSAGGWADLHPTLALQNLGCDDVVYVSRSDPESNFAIGVARLLGMDDATETALYDLAADSSYARSVEAADAVWCTNWNEIPGTEVDRIIDDAYSAPMETTDPVFSEGDGIYAGVTDRTGRVGCTPGVAP